MRSLVLSIGGSVIAPDLIDSVFLRNISSLLMNLSSTYKLFLVVGGGALARKYIEIGRKLGLDENALDEVGIKATWVNAQLFISLLKNSNKQIPRAISEAVRLGESYNIVVMGGMNPGRSTDAVAAEVAERVGADKLIIATNVDGVYDKDPNLYSDAKMFDEITIDELIRISGDLQWNKAGKNMVIDGLALQIIKHSKIPTFVINGKKTRNIEDLLKNELFIGTKILA